MALACQVIVTTETNGPPRSRLIASPDDMFGMPNAKKKKKKKKVPGSHVGSCYHGDGAFLVPV